MAPSAVATRALAIARAQIGKMYVWGASGPRNFDCSGLTWYAYQKAGHSWTRMSDSGQAAHGVRVSRANLIVGDLVRPHVGHIQLYAGGGRIVEAPSTGHPVREVPMWGFYDGTRIVSGGTTPTYPAFPGTMSIGSSGAGVRALQTKLKARGYKIVVDGKFGPATHSAVIRFQQYAHQTADGIAGPLTWRALWTV